MEVKKQQVRATGEEQARRDNAIRVQDLEAQLEVDKRRVEQAQNLLNLAEATLATQKAEAKAAALAAAERQRQADEAAAPARNVENVEALEQQAANVGAALEPFAPRTEYTGGGGSMDMPGMGQQQEVTRYGDSRERLKAIAAAIDPVGQFAAQIEAAFPKGWSDPEMHDQPFTDAMEAQDILFKKLAVAALGPGKEAKELAKNLRIMRDEMRDLSTIADAEGLGLDAGHELHETMSVLGTDFAKLIADAIKAAIRQQRMLQRRRRRHRYRALSIGGVRKARWCG